MESKKEKWATVKTEAYQEISQTIEMNAIYEVNNSVTQDRVRNEVTKIVNEYWEYLSETKIICDGIVNTPDTIVAHEFRLKFCWKVEPTDEWTIVDFTLSPSGMEVK